MDTNQSIEPRFTERQVEKNYPVKRKTLQNWRFNGKGPAYHKIGRNVFYRLSDLEDFFNRGRVEPANE